VEVDRLAGQDRLKRLNLVLFFFYFIILYWNKIFRLKKLNDKKKSYFDLLASFGLSSF
jgi:hypothetical protein